jgi:integrase
LKVPVGELNTGRPVPLEEPTLELVRELRQEGRPDRIWLFETKRGRCTRREATGQDTPNGLTSHRLRHTYATSRLNAGMSFMGVMKLLGHRDYRMKRRLLARLTVRAAWSDTQKDVLGVLMPESKSIDYKDGVQAQLLALVDAIDSESELRRIVLER